MAISGDLKTFGTFASYHPNHLSRPIIQCSKIQMGSFSTGGSSDTKFRTMWPRIMKPQDHVMKRQDCRCFGTMGNNLASAINKQDAEGFLLNAINMNFFERINLAWRILFPTLTARRNSNAHIAKQRLKMILFSDRCAVSDEAKQKIVSNIVEALSDFVEIDSQEKVQLSVSTDPDLGTVYSVTVPVRRVKPEYQETEDDYRGKITGIEYKDKGETSGSVDVTFDFYIPNGN